MSLSHSLAHASNLCITMQHIGACVCTVCVCVRVRCLPNAGVIFVVKRRFLDRAVQDFGCKVIDGTQSAHMCNVRPSLTHVHTQTGCVVLAH